VGKVVQAGDPIGHPSCEGGEATGTHVHIARKYNGEWIAAGGVIPFTLDGWVAHRGVTAYEGTLTKGGRTIIACTCSDATSQISANK
jgi:LasA protease